MVPIALDFDISSRTSALLFFDIITNANEQSQLKNNTENIMNSNEKLHVSVHQEHPKGNFTLQLLAYNV